jgi:imidazolonepropionase-like amidohydrolase
MRLNRLSRNVRKGSWRVDKTYIKAGRLLDGAGGEPILDPVIEVTGDRVTGVARGDITGLDGHIIDLGKATLMPGMWDVHVHIWGVRNYSPAEQIINPRDLLVLRAAQDCRNLLQAGFTSVRDCGSVTALSLSRAVKEGTIDGPNIWASGTVISQTGGHADKHYLPISAMRNNDEEWGRLADGPDDCRRAVREAIRMGADFVKICTSGGVGSANTNSLDEHFTPEEIAVMTSEAHRANRRVATHAQGAPGVKNAIKNGVDTVEHGYFLDDECLELMLSKGTYFVPTICLIEVFRRSVKNPLDMPPWRLKKQQLCIEAMEQSFPRAYKAGVKIATGSDYFGAPMRAHGDNADEPITMVNMGMAPKDAIVASTKMSATTVGVERDYGTVAPGKYADIIAIDGNPLSDINLLKTGVRFVMKAGKVKRNDL